MFTAKNLEYFSMVEELCNSDDEIGLVGFIDQRIDEFISLLHKVFSQGISAEKLELLKEILLTYSISYKNKSLNEIGSDLCTLIGLLEIYNGSERDIA